mmetsp:Transcript_16681/g.39940  ORF Transcript_16681/g.39940 Transcript_16681/m.39940 type:complete len:201 (-) Transcript_16681:88-690(-)
MNSANPSKLRGPLNDTTPAPPAPSEKTYLIFGKPFTPNFEHSGLPPFVVQSTSAIVILVPALSVWSARWTQVGAIFLQCPHHGAKNLIMIGAVWRREVRAAVSSIDTTLLGPVGGGKGAAGAALSLTLASFSGSGLTVFSRKSYMLSSPRRPSYDTTPTLSPSANSIFIFGNPLTPNCPHSGFPASVVQSSSPTWVVFPS